MKKLEEKGLLQTVDGKSRAIVLPEPYTTIGKFQNAASEDVEATGAKMAPWYRDVAVVAVEKYARSRGLGDMAPNGGWLTPDGTLYKNGAVWEIPEELRGNVRFAVADANGFLTRLADDSLCAVIANFSDPWPGKGTDRRKRLTSPAFLENYRRVLTKDGVFSFKTDNDELFDYTAEVLPENGFEIRYLTRDLHASDRAADNIVTEYERNFTEQGIKIKMLEAVPVGK